MIKTGGNALVDAGYILERAQVGANMKIADLGCGATGHYIFPAASIIGKRGKVYAVDILKTVLESLDRRIKQENHENIITVWSDLEVYGATKIEPSSLDVAFLNNTLYQSKKRPQMIREAIRLIKRKGKLVVVEWKNIASPIGPPPEMQVNKDNLINACRKLGLELEEDFEAGKYHYGLIFIKM